MPEITDNTDTELRRIAAALVAEAPDAPPLTDAVGTDGLRPLALRRRPHRRSPRPAVAAAVAALALLAGGVIALTGGDDGTSEPDYGFMAQAGLEPAPQRLIYDERQELTAEGEVVPLELDGLDAHGPPRPLPDGGHVVVGIRPVSEPLPEDFNEFTDLTFELAVVGADGEVEVEHDLGNEQTTLVGVTPTDAVLIRQPEDDRGMKSGPASLVAHDLATGDERVVHRDVSFDPGTNAWARWAVVGTDLVTVAAIEHLPQTPEGESEEAGEPPAPMRVDCTLRINDLTTGDDEERPLDLGCREVMGLQASPDGSQAAVVYDDAEEMDGSATYLAVIDLPSGEVVHKELLGERSQCPDTGCPPGAQNIEYHGVAWDDAATVRVALTDITSTPEELVVKRIRIG